MGLPVAGGMTRWVGGDMQAVAHLIRQPGWALGEASGLGSRSPGPGSKEAEGDHAPAWTGGSVPALLSLPEHQHLSISCRWVEPTGPPWPWRSHLWALGLPGPWPALLPQKLPCRGLPLP